MPDVINPWWFAPAGLLIFGGLAWAATAYLIRRLRARRFIARLRAEGHAMTEEGYFQPDQERRLLVDAYDSSEVPPWEQS